MDKPFAGLSDGVISLRMMEIADAPWIVNACRDPLIPRFTMMPDDLSLPETESWIQRMLDTARTDPSRRVLITDSADQPLGTVGAGPTAHPEWRNCEVYYWIAAPARGRGIATRAVRLMSHWAFRTLSAQRLELLTHVDNIASQRVAEKSGYSREGIIRSARPIRGQRPDLVLFSLLPTDGEPDGGPGA